MTWATVVEQYQIPYMLTALGEVLYTADGALFASADPLPEYPWDEAAAGAAVWTQQSSTAATWTKVA